jgi:hypothetical protein
VTHGNTVSDSNGAEFARRATGFVDAFLGGLSLAHERNIAGRSFIPARHHADKRPMDFVLLQTHGVVVRPVRGTRWPFRHVAAWQFRFVERLRVHCIPRWRLYSGKLNTTESGKLAEAILVETMAPQTLVARYHMGFLTRSGAWTLWPDRGIDAANSCLTATILNRLQWRIEFKTIYH